MFNVLRSVFLFFFFFKIFDCVWGSLGGRLPGRSLLRASRPELTVIVSQVHDHLAYILLVIRPAKYQDFSLAVRIPLMNVKQGL